MKILNIGSAPVTFAGGNEKINLEIAKQLSVNHDVTILQTNLYQENEKILLNQPDLISGRNLSILRKLRFLFR